MTEKKVFREEIHLPADNENRILATAKEVFEFQSEIRRLQGKLKESTVNLMGIIISEKRFDLLTINYKLLHKILR